MMEHPHSTHSADGPGGAMSSGLARAVALYRGGRFDAALRLLEDVLAAEPGLAAAHYLRGIVLKDGGDAAGATAAFDSAASLDPTIGRLYYHRGTARFLAGDRKGAFADLLSAIEREPDLLFAIYNLGVAAVSLRRWEEARRAFGRCLELDPANRAAYVDLLVEIGRSEAFEEAYGQVHRIKNMVGVVGDQQRAVQQELDRLGPAVPAPLKEGAARVSKDLGSVYEDMVRFLRAVDQEPPVLDLIDVADMIERALFALSPRLRGIRIDRDIAGWLPEVIGDRRSLGEGIMNVLTNAIEAVEDKRGDGATIAIALRAVDDIPEVPGIDTVEVEIRDSGSGIAPDVLRRVFELGYTTKRFGTGIGLAYTERVVRAHGGRIQIESKPGKGTMVVLVLPASPVGQPNLRTLSMRSLLFEDLRPIGVRGDP